MKSVFEAAWKAMEEYIGDIKEIEMDTSKRVVFIDNCIELYDKFSKEYMNRKSKELDRHKIGAIISIVGSSDDYIRSVKATNKKSFFIARYNIPIVIALSFIEQGINKDLHENKIIPHNKKAKLHIPLPSSCTTLYVDSLSRILLFEEREKVSNTLRVIELANVFFLIEECSLLKLNINMKKWIELKRKC